MNELLLALLLSMPLADAPDERIVCVPRSDGSGWDCGKGAQAPSPRALPQAAQPAASAEPPPLYLIDPAQMPKIVRESLERGDYATAEAASAHLPPAPRVVRSADEPEPPDVVVRADKAPAPSAPVAAAESAPTPDTAAAAPQVSMPPPQVPVSAPEPVAVATPAPVAAPPVEPAAAAVAPPVDAAALAQRPPRSVSSSARDASELLSLRPDAYTVQLAAARSFQGFVSFRQALGVAVEDTFVVRVRRNGEDWWLMLWRDFADLASARAAAASLPDSGRFWPRRLAPLQAEARAAK